MAKALLGELLVSSKVITREQLDEVLAAPKTPGKKVGQLLLERGWLTEGQLTQTLSLQLGVPWVSLYHIDFSRQLLNRVPREMAERLCLVPIFVRTVKRQGDTLYVATDDPQNEAALAEVARAAKLPVRPMIASTSDIRSAIRVYYAETPAADSQPTERSESVLPPEPARKQPTAPPGSPPRAAPVAPPATTQPTVPAPTPAAAPPPEETTRPSTVPDVPISVQPVSSEPPSVEPEREVDDVPKIASPKAPEPVRFAETLKPADVARPPEKQPSAVEATERASEPPRSPSRPDSAKPGDPAKVPSSGPKLPGTTPTGGVPAKRPRMVALTLLDGTQLSLPARGRKRQDTAPPSAGGVAEALTARDLVSALRAVSHGADASEILGDQPQWEPILAALLSILLRKGMIADWEFIDEYRKI